MYPKCIVLIQKQWYRSRPITWIQNASLRITVEGVCMYMCDFQIRLDAPSIYMPKLKSALPLPPSQPHSHDPHHQNIYQLCACANGKLFLAPPHGACAAREDSLICRWWHSASVYCTGLQNNLKWKVFIKFNCVICVGV